MKHYIQIVYGRACQKKPLSKDGKEKEFFRKKLKAMQSCEAKQLKDFNFTEAETQAKERFQKLGDEMNSVEFNSEFTSSEGNETLKFGGFKSA